MTGTPKARGAGQLAGGKHDGSFGKKEPKIGPGTGSGLTAILVDGTTRRT